MLHTARARLAHSLPRPHMLVRSPQRLLSTDAASIETVGVVGAGQMGVGIAYTASKVSCLPNAMESLRLTAFPNPSQVAGVEVVLADKSPKQLTKGLQFVDSLLAKEIKKGKLGNEEADRVRKRIRAVEDAVEGGGFGEVDLAIEVSRRRAYWPST